MGYAGAAQRRTLFDLASLTKPCIAMLSSLLVRSGALRFFDRIDRFLPALRGTPGGRATIEEHLSHRAGMQAHRELFKASWAGASISKQKLLLTTARAFRSPSPSQANFPALYSDLGYILVGAALERVTGQPLDELVDTWIAAPLGIEIASARQWARKDANFRAQTPPTEILPERGGEIRGVVHDDNAWALSGTGTSGHAGLFGTLAGVLRFGALITWAAAGEGPLAHPAKLPLTPRQGGSLRMGFDGIAASNTMAGRLAESGTVGHLGFTGTSFWCDPQSQLTTVLLTNRTYPTRQRNLLAPLRPVLHDALRRDATHDR